MEIDDGNTYYEQYNTICSGVIKTGDYVYVAAENGKQTIAQVDSIWDTKEYVFVKKKIEIKFYDVCFLVGSVIFVVRGL